MTLSAMDEPAGATPSAAGFADASPPASFDELWSSHRSQLQRTALRLTGSRHDAEDLVQETALRALRGFEGFETGSNFASWSTCILHNLFCSARRQTNRREVIVAWDELAERGDGWLLAAGVTRRAEPEPMILSRVLDEELEAALASLPERLRTVFVLAHLRGLSYVEVGQRMRLPLGTVRSRLFRARAKLRLRLAEYAVNHGLLRPEELVGLSAAEDPSGDLAAEPAWTLASDRA